MLILIQVLCQFAKLASENIKSWHAQASIYVKCCRLLILQRLRGMGKQMAIRNASPDYEVVAERSCCNFSLLLLIALVVRDY